MKTYQISILSFCLFLFCSCEKDIDLENPDTTVPDTENGRTFGWSGSENEENIQDDILFFGSGNLPGQVDLSSSLPPVQNQGNAGTCVAWALGYYGKTGMNAQDQNYAYSQLNNPANQTSPKDLFFAIPTDEKVEGCQGTYLESAYKVMIERGVADMASAPYNYLGDCGLYPEPEWDQVAGNNRIESFRQIPVEVEAIKEKLAAGHFVGFGAVVRAAFSNYSGGVLTNNGGTGNGGHALLVVGYDDGRQAFKIVNSWGINWGENGFGWIDYNLFVNDFCKYAFVAYNSINPDPTDDPNTPPSNGANLRSLIFEDNKDEWSWNERDRSVVYNIYNTSNQAVAASQHWDAIYMYFNAYDMEDYGVILHERMSDEFGPGEGPYFDGLGSSGNWWYNATVAAQSDLGETLFGSWGLQWDYTMPAVTGEYYLVLMADAFNTVGETDEQDNFFFVTDDFGNPIEFYQGVGQGFAPSEVDDRSSANASSSHTSPVNEGNLNAYTPAELKFFLEKMKENGQLKRAVEEFDLTNSPKAKKD